MTKEARKYTRTIRLAPALGDWTILSPDAVAEPPIKIRPIQSASFDSLPREALRTAHYVHYRLAELICTKISKDMDIKVEIHSVSASQMTYGHFVQSVGDQVIQADLMAPSGDRINVLIDWPLAEQIIDRLTGGAGAATGSDEFSVIEAGILETQMEELVTLLPKVWLHSWEFDKLKFEFHAGTYHPSRKVSAREAYIVFEYQLLLGQGSIHRISWAYPNSLIRAMLSNYEIATRRITPSISLDEATLNRNKIQAKVILGNAQIAMSDLRSLQVGDVLLLDSSINAPLKLVLGNGTELNVQPGTIDDRLCAQIILWNTDTRVSSRRRHSPTTAVAAQVTPPISPPVIPIPLPVMNTPIEIEDKDDVFSPTPLTTSVSAHINDSIFDEVKSSDFEPATGSRTIDTDDESHDIFGSDFDTETDHVEDTDDDLDDDDNIDDFDATDDAHDIHDADQDGATDEHFESDDMFSSDYDLENSTETPATPKPEGESDAEDEFSWDDLEDEM